jgi:hypothetical protein
VRDFSGVVVSCYSLRFPETFNRAHVPFALNESRFGTRGIVDLLQSNFCGTSVDETRSDDFYVEALRLIEMPETDQGHSSSDSYDALADSLRPEHDPDKDRKPSYGQRRYRYGIPTDPLVNIVGSEDFEPRWDPAVLTVRALEPEGTLCSPHDLRILSHQSPDPLRGRLDRLSSYVRLILAQRRSYLFTPSLAGRIHNVVLPPGLLSPVFESDEGEVPSHLLVVPVVTLFKTPGVIAKLRRDEASPFRRAMTLTLIHIPLSSLPSEPDSVRSLDLRAFSFEEASEITATWDWSAARIRHQERYQVQSSEPWKYRLSGDLAIYLRETMSSYASSDSGRTATMRDTGAEGDAYPREFTLRGFSQTVLHLCGLAVSAGIGQWIGVDSVSVSKQRGLVTVSNWLEAEVVRAQTVSKSSLIFGGPIEDLAGRDCKNDNQALNLHPVGPVPSMEWAGDWFGLEDESARLANYLVAEAPEADVRKTVKKSRMSPPEIPEGARVEAYYVRPHSTLVYFYGPGQSQPHEPLTAQKRLGGWMLGYLLFNAIALSSARAMIVGLNRDLLEIEGRTKRRVDLGRTYLELDEVFDMDFAVRPNRSFYEAILKRDGVKRDFKLLEDRLGRVAQDIELVNSRVRDTVAVLLAAAIFAASIGVLIATYLFAQDRHTGEFFWLIVGISSVLALLGGALVYFYRRQRK